MPPKIIRVIRNGEICEVEEDAPARAPRRSVGNGNGVESDADSDDDGPRSAEDLVAQRLFGASASSSSGPTFDFSKAPLAVAWEDRARSLAGLPGLAVFGAHLSSRWLVALAVSAAAFGLKGLFICFVVWVLFKLGFEGETNRKSAGHQLGAHPHSGALPARALAAYLAAAGSGRAAAATAGNAPAPGATAAGAAAATTTVGGSAGAASAAARKNDASEDVRAATRNAWAAREAAVAAAAKAAAAAAAEKESKE